MKFVAIDLKAADFEGKDIGHIGVVVVENNLIVSAKEILINYGNLRSKTEFEIMWNQVGPLLDRNLVVAFNANKQMSLLLSMLDKHGIERSAFNFACSRFIAKKLWRNLNNYKLSTIANSLEIDYKEENVKENAIVCSEIFIKALQSMKVSSAEALYDVLQLQLGYIDNDTYRPVGRQVSSNEKISLKQCTSLLNKNVVFTGTLESMVRREAMKRVIKAGGVCANTVNQNTDVLVIGVQSRVKLRGKSKSSKMLRAERLREDGKSIYVITEDEFLKMI